MRLVVQRVDAASVEVGGERVAAIERGLLVLVGIERTDVEDDVRRAAAKLSSLRLFADDDGRMNRDLAAIGGRVLAVSQFTLAGSLRKGRRPSFDGAMEPVAARRLFTSFVDHLRRLGVTVETGRFQEEMKVHLTNDGPVTFVWESRDPA